jgi:hypothetical protein
MIPTQLELLLLFEWDLVLWILFQFILSLVECVVLMPLMMTKRRIRLRQVGLKGKALAHDELCSFLLFMTMMMGEVIVMKETCRNCMKRIKITC